MLNKEHLFIKNDSFSTSICFGRIWLPNYGFNMGISISHSMSSSAGKAGNLGVILHGLNFPNKQLSKEVTNYKHSKGIYVNYITVNCSQLGYV